MGLSSYTKQIISLGLPAMIENSLQMLLTVVDVYLVARISLTAVSAVSVAGNLIAVYQAVFIALGSAISSLVAKQVAREDKFGLDSISSQALGLTLAVSLLMGLLSVVFGKETLRLLGAELEIAALGGIYLAWVGGTIFLLGLTVSLGAILRARGQAKRPMYVSLLTNLLNVLLSAFAIFVLDMGIAGAALGTVLARAAGLAVLWSKSQIRLSPFFWRIDRELIRRSLPAIGERLIMRGGDILVLGLVIGLGSDILAGDAVGETLIQFNYLPAFSIASATVILTAKAQARRDSRAVEAVRRQSYRLSLLMMGLISASVLLFGPFLIALFTKDSQVSQISQQTIIMSFVSLPMTAGTLIYTGLWQGLGRPKLPFYATAFGMVMRISLGAFLAFGLNLSYLGILLGVTLDNLFRWLFLKTLYHKFYRRQFIHET